jgi:hypothetical protein
VDFAKVGALGHKAEMRRLGGGGGWHKLRSRRWVPHLRSKRHTDGMVPFVSRIERENEAARDRADAKAQAMKTVCSRALTARDPGTEATATEVLGYTYGCGHAMDRN